MVSGQAIHDRARALGIAPAEEAAAGGGEAEAQGDAKIDVGWITHDAVVYGPDCLEEHGKEEPVIEIFLAGRTVVGVVLVLVPAQQRLERGIGGRARLVAIVLAEAGTGLLTQAAQA